MQYPWAQTSGVVLANGLETHWIYPYRLGSLLALQIVRLNHRPWHASGTAFVRASLQL